MASGRNKLIPLIVANLLAVAARAAEPAPVTIDIREQPLTAALNEWARQTGLMVLAPDDAGAAGTRVPQVKGTLTPSAALDLLLRGLPYRYEFVNERTVTVYVRDGASGASRAPGVESIRLAQADGQPAPALDEVVVTGKVIFTQNDAFGATKLGLPVKDTPQTVNIVTADLMDFASMEAFDDFYKVDASSSSGHAIDGFPTLFYRGFRQHGDNAVRVDGFRLPGNIDLDLAMFDRFEVI
jgi:hypothetical protein